MERRTRVASARESRPVLLGFESSPLLTAAGKTNASEAMRPPISVAIALFMASFCRCSMCWFPAISVLCLALVHEGLPLLAPFGGGMFHEHLFGRIFETPAIYRQFSIKRPGCLSLSVSTVYGAALLSTFSQRMETPPPSPLLCAGPTDNEGR